MKKLHAALILSFLFLINTAGFTQNLILTQGLTPTQLIQNGLVGAGVSITNVSGQITTQSSGAFVNNGVAGFPFQSGLVLSTGSLNNLESVPQTFLSTDLGLPGDSTLDAIVSPQVTYDAQVINFDFSAGTDSVEFEFIFSSEEYNEYVNTSFNDVFGFYITGPGYAPGTNVAMIPGTATPISINNVNNGNSQAAGTGPCMNCNYFVDNLTTPTPVGLSPDGFTTPIKLKFPVWPCEDYSFKIAIADVGDHVFDSQVFFKQGSFLACPGLRPLVNNSIAQSVEYLCQGDSLILTGPPGHIAMWSNGDTTQSIVVTQAGNYSMTYNHSNCFAFSSVVQVVMAPTIPSPMLFISNDTLYSGITDTTLIYTWSLNGNTLPITQSSIISPAAGCYQLQVTNQYGCETKSDSLCITPTGLTDYFEKNSAIYPNPAHDVISIDIPVSSASVSDISIYDLCGKQVLSTQTITGNRATIDISTIPAGAYTLKVFNRQQNKSIMRKLLKQ